MRLRAPAKEWITKKAQRAPSFWTPLLILLAITPNIRVAMAQNNNPSSTNTKFDPDAGRDTSSCSIPPYQKSAFEPTAEMCEETTVKLADLTDDQVNTLAYKYAPYLFFHPLENYTINSVDATFDDPKHGKIWKDKPLESFKNELHQTDLLSTIRDVNLNMHASNYFFTHDLDTPEDYTRGAAFSGPEGNLYKSTAPIYFNAFEKTYEDPDRSVWVFNYYFYYTFNGIANMVSLSSYEGKESYTSFLLSPFGLHEGDWEGMSVMVCPSLNASQPLAVTYQQHGWQQTTDCTAGECTFFKETIHPVGFSALNSHATYAISTENMVYANVEVPFFVNLQGVLVVDRTAYLAADGTYRAFVPDKKNIKIIDNPEDVDFNKTNETDYWQGFAGHWGNSTKPVILPDLGGCLNVNQTELIDCPTEEEDPIFALVMQLFGIYPPSSNLILQAATELTTVLLPLFSETGIGPTGPIKKNHWGEWPDPINAPLWEMTNKSTTAEEYCTRLVNIHDTGRTSVDNESLDVMANLIGIVVLCICLVVITVLYLWCGRKRRVLLEFDEDTGEVIKPGRQIWIQIHSSSTLFTIWFLVVVAGALMFGITLNDLFELLDIYVTGIDWHSLGVFLIVLGIVIMVIDCILCVLIWLPSQSLWNKIMQLYHHYKGEEEMVELYNKDVCNISFGVLHKCFLVGFALLFISLMLSAVVVVVGVGVVGFSAAFNELCETTVGSLDGICLNLSFFGIEKIACGPDFQEFCNLWASTSRFVTLWGGILIAIGHFYLVGAAGAAYHQQTDTMPMLDMLPRRKDYLQRIEDINKGNLRNSEKSHNQSHFMDNLKH